MTATIDLLPSTIDVSAVRGDDAPLLATIISAAGAPMDLTGCGLRFALADADGTLLTTLTWSNGSGSGVTVADPTSGVAAITIPHATTATLIPRRPYRYDLEVTDAGGEVTTVVTGKLLIVPDVSR